MSAQTKFVTVLLLLCAPLAGCVTATGVATETERELCIQWRDSLPTRSRHDTQRTRDEIGAAYDAQEKACPDYPRW